MEAKHTQSDSTPTAENLLQLVSVLVKEVHPNFPASKIITLDSDFEKDLSLDSLTRVQLISRIESTFNLALPERTFAEAETGRDLLREILKAKPSVAGKPPLEVRFVEMQQSTAIPSGVTTLIEMLDWHVKQHPDRMHIQLYEHETEGESVSYQQLKEGAEQVAAGLQSLELQNAEAVAIMLPTGIDYFYSFFGILMAGGIPVPIYPPVRASQLEDHMRRHSKILVNCNASLLITVSEARRVARLLKSQVPNLKKVTTVAELQQSSATFVPLSIKAADTAFIQYTSGSTGQPKGVVLSHANLLANIRAMGEVVEANSNDVFVSWLPLYHDMGLIGAWLGSLYYAALFVVMSPLSFLSHPERWLWAIHHYRGTLSASPNFGYEYCLRRIDDKTLQGLDLSSWRAAFNGAEAVSAETLENFSQRFSEYGFKAKAMMPVYGLAECSVGLAFPAINRGPKIDNVDRTLFMRNGVASLSSEQELALRFPSSGQPLPGHQVRIVDQMGHELPERQQGKIQFKGPSATSGYYRNAEKNQALFVGDWLDAGDLGYIANGEVYVTGRIKDIIIRAGRNIYPHELEEAVGNINGIRAGRVAVFGSEDKKSKTERLIVLAETRVTNSDELEKLRRNINDLSIDLTGAPADDIVLAPPNTVLKTSSGKIRRTASRQLYESGKLLHAHTSVFLQFTRLIISSIVPQFQRTTSFLKKQLFAIYSWSIFAFLAPVVWLTALFSPSFQFRWFVTCKCAKTLAKFTGTSLTLNGKKNIPTDGRACIFVSNHASYLDVYALVALLPGCFRFVAKKELSKKFITRKPLENIHTVFVDREDVGKSVAETKQLAALLRSGESLVFFAEGTFSRIPGLMPFHLGAFTLAADTGVSIVPVAIRGTRSILRADSWFPHRGSIHLEIGEPIDPKKLAEDVALDNWNKAINLRDQSRKFILHHCGEPDLS